MPVGHQIIAVARQHLGEVYKLGAQVTFENPNHKGPWDCAEFTTWVVYQATGILLGCKPRRSSHSEAYTGYWFEDAATYALEISVSDALARPGAMLARRAVSKKIGHIAISLGDGHRVIEAAGTGLNVREFTALGRHWDIGIRIPEATEWQALVSSAPNALGVVFRASNPPGPKSPQVEAIQVALKKAGYDPGPADGVFGIWTEQAVANFQGAHGLVADGMVGRLTGQSLGLNLWGEAAPIASAPGTGAPGVVSSSYNEKYGVTFGSLVDGGFFSSDPDDKKIRRAIRTNNPGALNISKWQEAFAGYVGVTGADNSADKNRTTIYRTPEHGVAAWYHLLTRRYGFGSEGTPKITDLARRYAGGSLPDTDPRVKAYVDGWNKHSNPKLTGPNIVHLGDLDEVLNLARGVFGHEIGNETPLSDGQIRQAIALYRDDQLPP